MTYIITPCGHVNKTRLFLATDATGAASGGTSAVDDRQGPCSQPIRRPVQIWLLGEDPENKNRKSEKIGKNAKWKKLKMQDNMGC